jgi:hypothetical protein
LSADSGNEPDCARSAHAFLVIPVFFGEGSSELRSMIEGNGARKQERHIDAFVECP